jgi:hypothetical protein
VTILECRARTSVSETPLPPRHFQVRRPVPAPAFRIGNGRMRHEHKDALGFALTQLMAAAHTRGWQQQIGKAGRTLGRRFTGRSIIAQIAPYVNLRAGGAKRAQRGTSLCGNLLPVPPSPDGARRSLAMGSVFGAAAPLDCAWGTMLRACVRFYGAFGAAPASRGLAAWGGSSPISPGPRCGVPPHPHPGGRDLAPPSGRRRHHCPTRGQP